MLALLQDGTLEDVGDAVGDFGDAIGPWIPSAVAALILVGVLFAVQRVLQASGLSRRRGTGAQISMLALTFAGLSVVLLASPLEKETRGQLLGFFGIVLSAAIALSSTTLLGNALAGVMLRAVRNFRVGDFLKVGDVFGRVTERGLVHTEVQTEDRDLVTLPHLFLVTNPVTVMRSSGTIISATVSLGYDVPRGRIEELLLEAARETELEEPFVQVLDLLDHAVVYRVAGLLREVTQLLSTRSRLRKRMLDALHGAGIEIVSPGFVNMRNHDAGKKFIPPARRAPAPEEQGTAPESVVFDKAEEAATLESLRDMVSEVKGEVREAREAEKKAPEAEREPLTKAADALERRLERLTARLEAREEKASEEKK